jgi:hypothetical protein
MIQEALVVLKFVLLNKTLDNNSCSVLLNFMLVVEEYRFRRIKFSLFSSIIIHPNSALQRVKQGGRR